MRYLPLIIAAFVVTTASSCVKSYDCVCIVEYHDNGKIDLDTTTSESPGFNRKTAKETCDAGDQNDINSNGYGIVRECELK